MNEATKEVVALPNWVVQPQEVKQEDKDQTSPATTSNEVPQQVN